MASLRCLTPTRTQCCSSTLPVPIGCRNAISCHQTPIVDTLERPKGPWLAFGRRAQRQTAFPACQGLGSIPS